MQVIGHDDERVNDPGAADRGFTELLLEACPVDVVANDVLPAAAASHQVVDRARVLEA
jgi:hypothetical protein